MSMSFHCSWYDKFFRQSSPPNHCLFRKMRHPENYLVANYYPVVPKFLRRLLYERYIGFLLPNRCSYRETSAL